MYHAGQQKKPNQSWYKKWCNILLVKIYIIKDKTLRHFTSILDLWITFYLSLNIRWRCNLKDWHTYCIHVLYIAASFSSLTFSNGYFYFRTSQYVLYSCQLHYSFIITCIRPKNIRSLRLFFSDTFFLRKLVHWRVLSTRT